MAGNDKAVAWDYSASALICRTPSPAIESKKKNATSLRRWRFGVKTLAMTYSCMA